MKLTDHYLQGKKKVLALLKDDLGGKRMKEFVMLRPKMYNYLKVHNKTRA